MYANYVYAAEVNGYALYLESSTPQPSELQSYQDDGTWNYTDMCTVEQLMNTNIINAFINNNFICKTIFYLHFEFIVAGMI